jgi:F-type H+-transporting ATPase subunit delta
VKPQELSRKYATAVFSLAMEEWMSVLNQVQDKLADKPELVESLENPGRTFEEKKADLDKLLPPEGADQKVRNFLYTLLEKEEIGLLGEILQSLEQMSRGGPQVQVVYVTTAIELSDNDKEQFRKKLRSQYGDNLEFVFRVDQSIIGGAIVQIGDKVIDGSVATRLESMSQALGVKG